MATTAATATTTITIVPPPPGGDSGDGGGCGARPGGNGGGDGQTAAGFWLQEDHHLDHCELADQVEAIRALLQSLRELVPENVACDRLSQTVGKRRACERGEARSRSERKRERVRRPWRCDAVAVMRERG